MKNSIINLWFSCFNASLNVVTRVVLIVISVSVYHAFVLAEVLLNNSNVWYPDRLSKLVDLMQQRLARFTFAVLRKSTTKVFYEMRY